MRPRLVAAWLGLAAAVALYVVYVVSMLAPLVDGW